MNEIQQLRKRLRELEDLLHVEESKNAKIDKLSATLMAAIHKIERGQLATVSELAEWRKQADTAEKMTAAVVRELDEKIATEIKYAEKVKQERDQLRDDNERLKREANQSGEFWKESLEAMRTRLDRSVQRGDELVTVCENRRIENEELKKQNEAIGKTCVELMNDNARMEEYIDRVEKWFEELKRTVDNYKSK